MKVIFADTFYWIALINPRDNWHTIALDYAKKYADDYLYLPSPKLSTPLTSNEKRHLK